MFQSKKLCCSDCRQRFHCEVLPGYASYGKETMHFTAAFTLGGAALQGHVEIGVMALRLQWEV